jgi:pimeloyl-ACP methyl ester carboxylesterase
MGTHLIARMAVEVDGEGEPVLFIHGLGGTSNTFTPQVAALAGRVRALRPDLPGSGRSPLPERVSIGGFVAAMASVCDVAGAKSVHVVAHSLGTIIAQHLAVDFPALVRGLLLLGPLIEPADGARTALRGRAAAVRAGGMADTADAVARGSLAADTRERNPAAVAFVRESLMRQPAEGYAATCEALADAHAADARSIRCPVLLLAGADDSVAPPSVARQLAERIDGARAETLPRCGHWISIERADEVNRRLPAFLAARPR